MLYQQITNLMMQGCATTRHVRSTILMLVAYHEEHQGLFKYLTRRNEYRIEKDYHSKLCCV